MDEPKMCLICGKKTDKACSHIDCPNRKPVTAAVPDTVEHDQHGTGGYAVPTTKEQDE